MNLFYTCTCDIANLVYTSQFKHIGVILILMNVKLQVFHLIIASSNMGKQLYFALYYLLLMCNNLLLFCGGYYIMLDELGLVRTAINCTVNQYNCFFLTSAFGVHIVLAFTTAKSKFRFSQILLNENPDMSPPVY